jgi:hypothetical protein
MKRTPWFRGSVQPVRAGYYETRRGFPVYLCYWTGSQWTWDHINQRPCFYQDRSWRGLQEEGKS